MTSRRIEPPRCEQRIMDGGSSHVPSLLREASAPCGDTRKVCFADEANSHNSLDKEERKGERGGREKETGRGESKIDTENDLIDTTRCPVRSGVVLSAHLVLPPRETARIYCAISRAISGPFAIGKSRWGRSYAPRTCINRMPDVTIFSISIVNGITRYRAIR